MNNNTLLSPEKIKEVITLSKPINTARITIFTLAGLSLFISIGNFILGMLVPFDKDPSIKNVSFGRVGLFYLLMGMWSKKKPFVPIFLCALINILLFTTAIFPLLTMHSARNPIYITVILIQGIITRILIRGFVFAKRYNNLTLGSSATSLHNN